MTDIKHKFIELIQNRSKENSESLNNELTVESIADYIPDVFEKISSNLACYFDKILNDEIIEM